MKDLVSTTEVVAPSRLHMGLLDCGYSSGRLFGGIGIAIDGLHTKVMSSESDDWSLRFLDESSVSARTKEEAHLLIKELSKIFLPTEVIVTRMAPEHKGLGSKTSLLLGITTAVSFGQGGLSREQIVRATGRGGTSGIGVNTFWDGGLITDSGHRSDKERVFAPSSVRRPDRIPFVINRIEPPNDWAVRLFYDPDSHIVDGVRERDIFRAAMPVPDSENLISIAAAHHGVVPAFISADLEELSEALVTLNTHGMKAIELASQTERTQNFMRLGWEQQSALGLSSFGPVVYEINEKNTIESRGITQIAEEIGMICMGSFDFNNTGAKIT